MYLHSPNGLGDNLYLRAVVLHLLQKGEALTIYTLWADLFHDLPIIVLPIEEVAKCNEARFVNYPTRHALPEGLNEFDARCRNVGINESVRLRLGWTVTDADFVDQIKRDAAGRRIFVYQAPRTVQNGVLASALLRPRRDSFRRVVERHADCYRIKLGHPPHVDRDDEMPCELDLFGKGFILRTMDVCTAADLFFAQPCFITVAAEMLDRPYICMFARAALDSDVPRANTTTPSRISCKPHLLTVVYDDDVGA